MIVYIGFIFMELQVPDYCIFFREPSLFPLWMWRYSLCTYQMKVHCLIFANYFWVCLWGCLWMSSALDSVDWVQNAMGIMQSPGCITRAKRRKKGEFALCWSRDTHLFLPSDVYAAGSLALDSDWVLHHQLPWFSNWITHWLSSFFSLQMSDPGTSRPP